MFHRSRDERASGARADRKIAFLLPDTLLALGLLLVNASQLRLPGTAIGPGEICLLAWCILMLCRETARLGPPLTPALTYLLAFWILLAIAESLGTLTAYVIGDVHDPALFLHDIFAYSLVAAISCLSVTEPGAAFRLRRVAWLLAILGAAFLALQLANAWEFFAITNLDPWYWDRLRGWSDNPIQLVVTCLVVAGVSLHLAETAQAHVAKLVAAACAMLAISVGVLTKTDALTLAFAIAGLIIIVLTFRSWLHSSEREVTVRFAFVWIMVLILPLALMAAAPLGYAVEKDLRGFSKKLTRENGAQTEEKTSLRFFLWQQAIARGLESGSLGLGPGPHLDIPASLIAAREGEHEPENLVHPSVNGTPDFEAHNTLLDLFAQGGLIATLSFIWLAATTLTITYRANLVALTALFGGLAVISFFHLIIRLPLFWFAVALCLVVGTETRNDRRRV